MLERKYWQLELIRFASGNEKVWSGFYYYYYYDFYYN